MLDIYSFFLTFIIIILVVVIIVIIAAIISEVIISNNIFNQPTCEKVAVNLPDISTTNCCFFSEKNTTLKYDRNFNMILAPFPTPYAQVCSQFCPTGDFNAQNITCNTTDTNALNNFNTCISELAPKQCKGQAMPIAISGGVYYYGYQATNIGCTACCACGQQGCVSAPCN